MYANPFKSWLDRLLEIAGLLVVVGLLLNWAWQLIRPLVPVIAVLTAIGTTAVILVRRNRSW